MRTETHIPGVLTMHGPESRRLPVIFDSPHSGTQYPGDFGYAVDARILRFGEDTFVNELFQNAPRHGAALLEAHFPRTYIDPNRPEDDLDERLLEAPWHGPLAPGIKTRSGIGLIWRLASENMPIYSRRLTIAEVRNRIDRYYRPYHRALDETIARARSEFGAVWHINCHSMPALSDLRSPEGPGRPRPDFCLGDRDGTTADAAFVRFVREFLQDLGYRVTVNDPYKGVELVRKHGRPADGLNSLQIEINRALHINEETRTKSPNFARLKADVDRLIAAICGYAQGRLGG
jgi:N-formylglutamate deformylase